MLNEKLRKAFEECERFIEESTQEELVAYEESLGLNYSLYSDGIDFSEFITLH